MNLHGSSSSSGWLSNGGIYDCHRGGWLGKSDGGGGGVSGGGSRSR